MISWPRPIIVYYTLIPREPCDFCFAELLGLKYSLTGLIHLFVGLSQCFLYSGNHALHRSPAERFTPHDAYTF